jgi:hypothetical protein
MTDLELRVSIPRHPFGVVRSIRVQFPAILQI